MAEEKRKLLDEELDKNYAALQEKLPDLIDEYRGKFALMRDGEIVDFYDTARDAQTTGQKLYEDGIFSVQEITDSVADLGFYSYAMSKR
mgnify:CR=1 FL=1